VGSLSIPLAQAAYASDISEKMVGEAQDKAEAVLVTLLIPPCRAGFETLSGCYHTIICLDVLIHYPQDKQPR